MDILLEQRLDLLKEVGEISQEIKDVVTIFIVNFEKKYSIEMTEDNASMLITHLAMALARIKRGELIEVMNDQILEEIKKSQVFNDLPDFYENIESKLGIVIPESEKGYLALHACSLVEAKK